MICFCDPGMPENCRNPLSSTCLWEFNTDPQHRMYLFVLLYVSLFGLVLLILLVGCFVFFLFYVFSFSLLINLIFLKFFIYSTVLIPILVWALIVPHPITPRHFFPFFIDHFINFSFSGMFSLVPFQILSIPFPSFHPSRKHPIISSLPLLLWGCSSTQPPTPTSLPLIPQRPSSATYAAGVFSLPVFTFKPPSILFPFTSKRVYPTHSLQSHPH